MSLVKIYYDSFASCMSQVSKISFNKGTANRFSVYSYLQFILSFTFPYEEIYKFGNSHVLILGRCENPLNFLLFKA